MSNQLLKPKTKKLKNGCRKQHYSCHSHNIELEYCKNCSAYVMYTENMECRCCGKKVQKNLKHTWVKRVMLAGMKQHRNFVNNWLMFPTGSKENPIYIEIKYRDVVYELDIKYLAIFHQPLPPKEILPLIKDNLFIKGIRLWVPDEEYLDEKCSHCGTIMKYNRQGDEFCPECNPVNR